MCEPATWIAAISAVVSIATGVTSYVQQKNNAEDLQENETKAANAAAASDYQQQVLQQDQINASSAQDMTERLKQSLKERAAIRTSSGEAGLNASGREELVSYQSASRDVAVMEANRKAGVAQTEIEKQATFSNAQSRINSAKARTPSAWMAGLQIGSGAFSSGVSGYAAGKSISSKPVT